MTYAAQLSRLLTSLVISETVSVFEKKSSFLWTAEITQDRTLPMTSTCVQFHLGTDERERENLFKSYPTLNIP